MSTSDGVAVVRLVDDQGELHEHTLEPGHPCPACLRNVPKVQSDEEHSRTRDRISITVPVGEEGILDEMMIALVEKYKDVWPEDARAARDGVGLALVGERSWRFRVVHFALFACLTIGELAPTEEG